ncbi:MAG: hypothetical protein IT444_01155 [Phycisphaeraceae bacterium]|nr:hypothetical protein [Phycisphaeraceae bacterium]
MTAIVHELGIPVKSANWVRLLPGQNAKGEPILLATMGQDNGGFFVCDIDLKTGHCTQYASNVPSSNFPTAAYMNPSTGVLYVGGAYSGHLHRYDPNAPRQSRQLEDLGPIDPELCSFPCRIDEATDGSIYIGGYGGASLTRFDPATKQFTRHGRLDQTDQYLYPFCGKDGTVAAVVRVCFVHVVVFNPRTGEHKTVGPTINVNDAGKGSLDGSKLDLIRGVDGLLYIKSSSGNFRLSGMDAVPVEQVPDAEPAPALPDGTRAEFLDAQAQVYRRVQITPPNSSPRQLMLDWEGLGTSIYMVHAGFDGKLYGSSILPEHFFRCNPDGSDMIDLGQCSVSTGEAYSMGNLDGKIYIASYPGARLSIYDPSKPYNFGEEPGSNPRDIGRIDQVAFRPRAMLTGPAGKVWIGSVPDYGMWGGTLVHFDPKTEKIVSHRNIVQDASVIALTWLPKLGQILVGLGIQGGSGTTPRINSVPFVWWDPFADRATASDTLGFEHLEGVSALLTADDGNVYATVRARNKTEAGAATFTWELLLIDPAARRIISRNPFQPEDRSPVECGLLHGPNGAIYGATTMCIYRIPRGTTERQVIWRATNENTDEHLYAIPAVIGNRYYFNAKHRLRYLELPSK